MKTLMLFFGITMLFSCQSNLKFNSWELSWLDVYNQGDTLIFESANHDFDTTFIERKDTYYQAHDGILRFYGVVWYRNSILKYDRDGARLITLIKNGSNTSFSINYLYAGYVIADFNEQAMEKSKQKGQVYEFNITRSDGQDSLPKALSWDTQKGLIEYITHDGVVWRRLN